MKPPFRAKINSFINGIKDDKILKAATNKTSDFVVEHLNNHYLFWIKFNVFSKKEVISANKYLSDGLVNWINEIQGSPYIDRSLIEGLWLFYEIINSKELTSEIKTVEFKDCLKLEEIQYQQFLYVIRDFIKDGQWIGIEGKPRFMSFLDAIHNLGLLKVEKQPHKICKAFINSFAPVGVELNNIEIEAKRLTGQKALDDVTKHFEKIIISKEAICKVKLPQQ